eukprot:GGOE01027158.1.p3 GENE.GGOE01027158.1~~GGOE01027158.1.p3  ORF type:complete len:166 (+),score=5.17 GGOE01027158.1:974-1471(+)
MREMKSPSNSVSPTVLFPPHGRGLTPLSAMGALQPALHSLEATLRLALCRLQWPMGVGGKDGRELMQCTFLAVAAGTLPPLTPNPAPISWMRVQKPLICRPHEWAAVTPTVERQLRACTMQECRSPVCVCAPLLQDSPLCNAEHFQGSFCLFRPPLMPVCMCCWL